MADEAQDEAEPALLDAVALLAARPDESLRRGEVGTVVEELDARNVLVEFSDDDGRAYAIVPCLRAELLVLHNISHAA